MIRAPGSATAESREVASGSDPTLFTVRMSGFVGVCGARGPAALGRWTDPDRAVLLAGRKSTPSGLSRYPGARDATST